MMVSSRQSPRFSLNKQKNVLSARSANSISVISDEDYFVQDSYNLNDSRSREYDIEKIQKKKNYFLTFRPSIFLEFAFYHLLFYLILGPLTILLLKIKPGICIKYATYDNYQILTVKHKVLTVEDIRQETLLLSWYHQTTPIIYNETSFQLRRHEIIESMFYITFMKKPKKKLIEKLKKNTEELQLFNSKQYQKPRPLGELIRDDLYIDCQGVIKKLVDHFHKIKDSVRNKQLAIGFLYPLIRIIIPYITRLYEGKQVFGGNGYEVSCMIMSTLIQYYAFLSLNMIVLMGIYDIYRKNYFMEQLAYILSPRRIGITDSLKLLPSINLFSQVNLKGWMLLRKVLFDYGYKFHIWTYRR
ncbi:hypothetical protein PPERSA_01248 [Pseudocohnilembus persalinus]|uniref:Uncharacterized protein n=1 Tax=Pseudocohnilembus persalinus TaxID=266149 RepID=A0A0V0QGE4_PSEPJ|nr:hypothetical protein PPERSA_01248 [Pseudocohnilembus persalinus]|eukprot:KRX01345.1 hypothetical protein PPERSA_01248 [Pseudocohnilembus persalinus]